MELLLVILIQLRNSRNSSNSSRSKWWLLLEKKWTSQTELIQSVSSGVNTSVMEKDLEAMNDLWNSLKQSLAERERKLDQGLLQSGAN